MLAHNASQKEVSFNKGNDALGKTGGVPLIEAVCLIAPS
jgi:hypothetical protein